MRLQRLTLHAGSQILQAHTKNPQKEHQVLIKTFLQIAQQGSALQHGSSSNHVFYVRLCDTTDV